MATVLVARQSRRPPRWGTRALSCRHRAYVFRRRDELLLSGTTPVGIWPRGVAAAADPLARVFVRTGTVQYYGTMSSASKTPREILDYAKKFEAKQLDLRFTDLPGLQQHISYPMSQLDEATFEEG